MIVSQENININDIIIVEQINQSPAVGKST